MVEELVSMYEKGDITAGHLAVQCLHMLDPLEPSRVLATLPENVQRRVLKYTREYRPGQMRTNYGIQPAADQVGVAKKWLEARDRQSA